MISSNFHFPKSGKSHFNTKLFVSLFVILFAFATQLNAQQAFITNKGESTICEGESTTIQVIIGASIGPYTIKYSDGITDYTISGYTSNANTESPLYGGDAISVSPTTTTNYELISVKDANNFSLPISSAQATVSVNPLVANLSLTVNSGNPVCYNTDFVVSYTATYDSIVELWDAGNTSKIGDLPQTISITENTNYKIRAYSPGGCLITEDLAVTLETVNPTVTCPEDQTLNPLSNCQVSLPDYTSMVTAHDNCTADGALVISQLPVAGTTLSGDGTIQNVVITVRDEAGNEATCDFDVTVTDSEQPVINGTAVNETITNTSGNCGYVVSGAEYDPTVLTDNCAIDKLTYSINGGTENGTNASTTLGSQLLGVGENAIVWTAYDTHGNTATWSVTISVEDKEKPTFDNCPGALNLTSNSADCNAVLPNYISLLSITASDNCTESGTISLSQSPVATTVLTGGHGSTQLVTITAEDEYGNSADCQFTVTVADETNPTITNLPSNISATNDIDECGAVISWTAPTSDDNCTGSTISQIAGSESGTLFPVGETTITYRAEDLAGNTHDKSFTVTITDNQNPEISCPGNISVGVDSGKNYATVSFTAPEGTDNCAGASTVQTTGLASDSQFPVGTTINTFIVTDAAGNKDTCSFDVNVSDDGAPVIIDCPENITVNNDEGSCDAVVSWTEPTASDNATLTENLVWNKSHTPGSTFPVGTTTVTYTVTDESGNTSTPCSFTITVNDNEKPLISNCPANISRTSAAGSCSANVNWTEPTISDNCTSSANIVWEKSHNPGDLFNVGVTSVTYVAKDENDNVSDTCRFTITVRDDQKPVIANCPSNITQAVDEGECDALVTWTAPTATDNCTASGDLVWTISHAPNSSFPVGTTTVTYSVKDSSNNTSSVCSFDVTVTDSEKPNAVCNNLTIYLDASGEATISATDINNNSSDNCTSNVNLDLSINKSTFTCSNLGANTVVLTVDDESGNSNTCNSTVTVLDTIPPVIVSKATTQNSTVYTDADACDYTIKGSEFDPTLTDNCSGATLSYTVSGATTLSGTGSMIGESLNPGVNTISWTAVDGSGTPTATAFVFTKTVVDNQEPTLSSIPNQYRSATTGCAYVAVGNEFDPSASDNCGEAELILEYKINSSDWTEGTTLAGTPLPLGTTTINWRASDGVNTKTILFRVEVVDETAPVISTISNMNVSVSSGCAVAVSWTEPTVSDNCDSSPLLSKISGPVNGGLLNIGVYTVKYQAIDTDDNVSEMQFTITVTDPTPPSITCASGSTELAPFEENTDDGLCFFQVPDLRFNPEVVSDECSYTLTNSFDHTNTLLGKQLPVGEYPIVWTVVDYSGNTNSCTIYVKIIDNQYPTFTIASEHFERNTDPGECFYTVPNPIFDPSDLSDNCEIDTVYYEISGGAYSTPQTGANTLSGKQIPPSANDYSIKWTVVDSYGLTVESTPFTLNVSDNQAPTFTCYGNVSRQAIDGSCEYTIVGAELDPTDLSDNCDANEDITLAYTINGTPGVGETLDGTTLSTGPYTIVWTATDTKGNSQNCTYKLFIYDGQAPTISTINAQSRDVDPGKCYYEAHDGEFDPTSTDNCGAVTLVNMLNNGTSLNGYQFPVGPTTVIWRATDGSGDTEEMEFVVTVIENEPPTFDLASTLTREAVSSCSYTTVGTEFDPTNLDDNCSGVFSKTNDYNNYKTLADAVFPVGTTTVTWTVTDQRLNSHQETIDIVIEDNTAPEINCPENSYVRVVDAGQNYYTVGVNEFKPVVSENCTLTSYTHNYNGGGTSLNGIQLPEGSHTIQWTAIDNHGNQSSCNVVVHIVSSIYPPIKCHGDAYVPVDAGECDYTITGTAYDATSTSSVATLSHDYGSGGSTLNGTVLSVGTHHITWTASQTIGENTYETSCEFYITIYDNQDPTITAPDDITINSNSGCYATGVNLGTPITDDNCGVSSTWNNAPSSYYLGTTNVTWWISDSYGNEVSAVQKVTVLDDDAPVVSCVGDVCREADYPTATHYSVNGTELDKYSYYDCSSVTITNSYNGLSSLAGENIPVGDHSITWTFTDAATNVSSCTMNLSIYSTEAPSVTCRTDIWVVTDEGVCSHTVNGAEYDVAYYSATGAVLTNNINGTATLAGEVLTRGPHDIIWTATENGFSNTCCTYTITVYDNEDPVPTWPDDVTVDADAGTCQATNVPVGTPSFTDNCTAPAAIVYSRTPSGTTFSVGTHTIYWTAHDTHGNYISHNQTITVNDVESPVIDCPSNRYYLEFDNLSVDYASIYGTSSYRPTVTEDCSLTSYVHDYDGGGTSLHGERLSIGDHAITWTATDASDNTDNCTINFTIYDSFDPLISCVEDQTLFSTEGECGYLVAADELDAVYTSLSVVPGRTLTHDYAEASSNTTLAGEILPPGQHVITWTAAQTIDGTEYTKSCTTIIDVIDTIAPTVDPWPEDITTTIDPGKCYASGVDLGTPNASDNCDIGDLTTVTNAPAQFELGTTRVVWRIYDTDGNQTTHTQNVTVTDNEAPVFANCPSNIVLISGEDNCEAVANWIPPTVSDSCSGIKSLLPNYPPGTSFPLGIDTIVYTATDFSDNVSTCSFTVTVNDEAPTITCIEDQTRNTNPNTCSYKVLGNEFDPESYSDNCGIASRTYSLTDATGLKTGSNSLSGVIIERPDNIAGEVVPVEITWIVTDASGLADTCTFSLSIEDNEGPVISVPGNQVRSTDPGKNYYTIQGDEFDDVVASDACGIVTKLENEFELESLDGQILHLGNDSIMWYAIDDYGNRSEAAFIILIKDTEAPTIETTPGDFTVYTSGSCEAVVTYTAPTFADNVDGSGLAGTLVSESNTASGETFPIGETDVTFVYTDAAGNTLSHTFTVTVVDNEDPYIVCPVGSPFSDTTDIDKAYYTVQGTEYDPTSYGDNCGASIVNDFNNLSSLSGARLPVGQTVITWTITDSYGATQDCAITVNVADIQAPEPPSCPEEVVARNSTIGDCGYLISGAEYDPYNLKDNHGIARLTYSIDGGAEVGTDKSTTIGGLVIPVSTDLNPTTSVLWRIYDLSENVISTCTSEFTITDIEAPVVLTVADQIKSTDAGESDYTIISENNWDASVSDNCEVETIVYSIDGGEYVGTDETTTIVGQTLSVGTHTIL
ncbi:HYR domain-containing protein [uncultured Draconibacterium sp.]|uniref:HYR domain-containing protein n=1 Tax=uncultured Draconibacterium sp. TaxID=1573823 RepID=UPI0032166F80